MHTSENRLRISRTTQCTYNKNSQQKIKNVLTWLKENVILKMKDDYSN